jgi:NADH-quinone oxidoreductase subunit G
MKVNLSRKNVEPIAELPEFNGTVIYRCEPVLQFSPFTHKAHQLNWPCDVVGSQQFAVAAKIKDGDKIRIHSKYGTFEKRFVVDEKLKGTIALFGASDLGAKYFDMQGDYRYEVVKIERVEHE